MYHELDYLPEPRHDYRAYHLILMDHMMLTLVVDDEGHAVCTRLDAVASSSQATCNAVAVSAVQELDDREKVLIASQSIDLRAEIRELGQSVLQGQAEALKASRDAEREAFATHTALIGARPRFLH